MKILFYDAKPYDIESFDKLIKNYDGISIDYLKTDISKNTVRLAEGYEAVCVFVASDVNAEIIDELSKRGVKLILLRCAGFNNVDIQRAKEKGITVLRVPNYSPEAIAEHALALAFAVNRHIHKAYIKVRENNFSLMGLTGMNLCGKVAGIVGTGKIGAAMCRACHGIGMEVLAFDKFENPSLDFVRYTGLDELLRKSDLISLHCPLTEETYHMIDLEAIEKMKDGVIIINNSRGALVAEQDLADALNSGKVYAAGLDVVSTEPVREDNPLLGAKNCLITPHISWAPKESRQRIMDTSVENLRAFAEGRPINVVNGVC